MKILTTIAILILLPLAALGLSVDEGTVKTSPTSISISAKGSDVRAVLHDLFTQAKKNYVIESVPRTELFLSLSSMDFDETVEIVCRLAGLTYEVQNDIYYISKKRPAITPTTNSNNNSNGSSTSAKPQPVAPVRTGKLSEEVLKRSVSGTFSKVTVADVFKRLGEQAKITIEIDPSVPKYKLDFKLNSTSLGYALRVLKEKLKLEVVFTDRQTLLIIPKVEEPVERLEIISE